MAKDTAGSASQLVDRLVNDAQFRESLEAAPTIHDKAQVIKAAGYGDVNVDAIKVAVKEQLRAFGAGVQADPERTKRVEELYFKALTDQELQQALQAAATPEAARAVLAQAGYGDITFDDLRATATDLAQREELSDQELELVSGGSAPGGLSDAFFTKLVTGGGSVIGGAATAGAMAAAGFGTAAVVGGFVTLGIGLAVIGIAAAIEYAPPPSDW
jgi:predicted ribosomally synthesized peptide with nif11-like leader